MRDILGMGEVGGAKTGRRASFGEESNWICATSAWMASVQRIKSRPISYPAGTLALKTSGL
jgi:hypothetical protein